MTRRSSFRAVVVVAIGCAAVVLGAYLWRVLGIVRDPMATFGGTVLTFEIDADHRYDDTQASDEAVRETAEAIANRAEHLAKLAHARLHGRQVDIELPATGGPPLDWTTRMLSRSGRIDFKIVDDGAEFMSRTVARFHDSSGITGDTDGWTVRASGDHHTDPYLAASEPGPLAAIVAQLHPPDDHELIVGEDDISHRSRTFYLLRKSEISGDRITDAEVYFDASSQRPEVNITFDERGARELADVTSRSVGRKLAILLEGHLTSAPVIESRIDGGHARITLGGQMDPIALQQEAKDLVAVLRVGSLAAPVRLIATRRVPAKHR